MARSPGLARRLLDQASGSAPASSFVRWAAAALIIVSGFHVLQAAALGSANRAVAAAAVSVVVAVAGACLAAFLWVFWQTPQRGGDRAPFALASVLAVAAIGACVEAFAGMTALLWRYNVAAPVDRHAPSLWRTEGDYVWHLLNSVPLLRIPQTLGWREPAAFSDHASGTVLLIFELAVIAPLVRLGLSGFRRLEKTRHERQRRRAEDERSRAESGSFSSRLWHPGPDDAWIPFAGVLVALAMAGAALVFLFDPSWRANRWLADRLDPGIQVAVAHVPLNWARTAPQWVVVAGLLLLITFVAAYLLAHPLEEISSPVGVAGAMLLFLAILVILTVTAATATLALLHVGLATATPAIPATDQPWAAVDAYAWAMADSLPGPDIPGTLNWSVRYRFTDHWSGAVLLMYKTMFVAVLAVPLARTVRAQAERIRPASLVRAALPSAAAFHARLRAAQAALDEYEWAVSQARSRTARIGSGFVLTFQTSMRACEAVASLDALLDRVRALFGDGDMFRVATAARLSVIARQDAIDLARHEAITVDLPSRGRVRPPPDLTRERRVSEARIAEFERAAHATFSEAAAAIGATSAQ